MGIIDQSLNLGLVAILDKLGVAESKQVGFFLPQTTYEQARTLLISFCSRSHWSLVQEKDSAGSRIFMFQVGQWGFSTTGSQIVYVLLAREASGVRGVARSKSTMGQLVSWGRNQKNLDALSEFFNQVFSRPGELQSALSTTEDFLPAKATVNPLYWWLIGFISLAWLSYILWFLWNLSIAP
jgi:hypothetical protein